MGDILEIMVRASPSSSATTNKTSAEPRSSPSQTIKIKGMKPGAFYALIALDLHICSVLQSSSTDPAMSSFDGTLGNLWLMAP